MLALHFAHDAADDAGAKLGIFRQFDGDVARYGYCRMSAFSSAAGVNAGIIAAGPLRV